MAKNATKYEKFESWLEKWLMPLADTLQNQRYLAALKEGMMGLMPVIMIGCFSLLVYAIPSILNVKLSDSFTSVVLMPFNMTMGLLSVYAAMTITYSLAKRYKLDIVGSEVTALAVQLILCSTIIDGKLDVTYLDSKGLFVSMFVGILTVEVTKFVTDHKWTFKMPDSVPPIIISTFQNIIPMFINIMLSYLLGLLIKSSSGMILPQLIMKTLAPAISSLDNPFALAMLILVQQLLWFFGLHGDGITSPIYLPLATQYLAANAAAKIAGKALPHVFTYGFLLNFILFTGSGLTGGLVLLMLFSKSKHLKAVAKVAAIPAIFNINEPVTFGLPIVLNPIMFIPFVIGQTVCAVIAYLPFYWGWLQRPFIDPPAFTPSIIASFLTDMDWRAVVLMLVIFVISIIMYWPFYRIMEDQELAKEQKLN